MINMSALCLQGKNQLFPVGIEKVFVLYQIQNFPTKWAPIRSSNLEGI